MEAWLAALVYQVGNVTFSIDAPQSAIDEITRRHISSRVLGAVLRRRS